MFDFSVISLNDRDWINNALAISDYSGAEYCFANNVAWQRLNDTTICRYGEFYISCSFYDGEPYLTFPSGVVTDQSGREKYLDLLFELKKHFETLGKTFRVCSVTKKDLDWLTEAYGDTVEVEYNRDSSDYIYKSDDLINFKGKRFHGKRNHLKRFMENDWSYEPVCDANLDECIAYTTENYNTKDSSSFSAIVEQYAINFFFTHMKELGLKGGVIRCDGKIAGVSLGERINSNTFVVHIEKAQADINGAYPAICSQFIMHNAADVEFINREEDMGIEGLRKSKLSYNPVYLLDKYTLTFK